MVSSLIIPMTILGFTIGIISGIGGYYFYRNSDQFHEYYVPGINATYLMDDTGRVRYMSFEDV